MGFTGRLSMPACLAAAPDCWGGAPVPGGLPGQGLDWPPAPGPRPPPAPLALGVGPPRLLAALVVHQSSFPLNNDAGMAGAGAQLQRICSGFVERKQHSATLCPPAPDGYWPGRAGWEGARLGHLLPPACVPGGWRGPGGGTLRVSNLPVHMGLSRSEPALCGASGMFCQVLLDSKVGPHMVFGISAHAQPNQGLFPALPPRPSHGAAGQHSKFWPPFWLATWTTGSLTPAVPQREIQSAAGLMTRELPHSHMQIPVTSDLC
ncbi:Intersectin-1 [Manis pentadactyla]|nr:Intersectin-1 [Manis pentadactyla]